MTYVLNMWTIYVLTTFAASVLWCSLEFSQNYNRTTLHFCGHMCSTVYKMQFERFEVDIFFKFWVFLPNSKLIFPFVLSQVLNYWTSFSLFWVGFPGQHLLVWSKLFFFLKTRVIKLLIIYLILKINKYINI